MKADLKMGSEIRETLERWIDRNQSSLNRMMCLKSFLRLHPWLFLGHYDENDDAVEKYFELLLSPSQGSNQTKETEISVKITRGNE
jgi:hypothetical protein